MNKQIRMYVGFIKLLPVIELEQGGVYQIFDIKTRLPIF